MSSRNAARRYRVIVTFPTGRPRGYIVRATHRDEAMAHVERYLAGRREWTRMRASRM